MSRLSPWPNRLALRMKTPEPRTLPVELQTDRTDASPSDPQSMVGPGFLAHMLVSQYVDHVPYHHQERIDLRGGLYIQDMARVRYTEQCALLLTIYRSTSSCVN